MDREAWQATVHRVAQSWTRLKQLRMHACSRPDAPLQLEPACPTGTGHPCPICLEFPKQGPSPNLIFVCVSYSGRSHTEGSSLVCSPASAAPCRLCRPKTLHGLGTTLSSRDSVSPRRLSCSFLGGGLGISEVLTQL